ncbi:MAG TPA: hypothetical protein VHU61_13345 [Solirubrobacteraceae bacterium]|nr:hypothetical protein [Solirubrobacteraceae bacterium]
MRRALFTVTALITAVIVGGCGGGSSKHPSSAAGSAAAHRLLVQTFDGHHGISSGVITLDLRVVPSGSSSIKGPIELAFGGPFVNRGQGKLPESDFTISISAEGHVGALQVISADGKGYITVSGQSYKLPASSYKTLESGFGSLASSGTGSGSGSSQSSLSKLGIKPLDWLEHPQIVGKATVDGVATTRIRAGLDATAMLQDFSTLLGKAGSLGVGGTSSLPQSIPASTQRSIAHALGSPSFNLWTGTADKLIRKLTLSAVVPVTGATRSELGGLRSATVTLGFEYSRVNQPQTISVPTSTKPYSVFRTEFSAILSEIESGLISGSTGSGTTTGASGGSDQKYTQCITAASGDVAKMQKCAKLLATG